MEMIECYCLPPLVILKANGLECTSVAAKTVNSSLLTPLFVTSLNAILTLKFCGDNDELLLTLTLLVVFATGVMISSSLVL